MEQLNGKAQSIVWITGASSGIGFALVKRYLQAGWRVIASARSEGELADLVKQDSHLSFVAFDMVDKEQIEPIRDTLSQLVPHLDCVILNAGTCEYLDLEDEKTDWQMMERVMSVNYFGLVNSVDVCLPLLKRASQPLLVGVSSQAVQAAFPRAEAYGASKAAIRYFLSSLRMDLNADGVDVTCVLPGFVDTPLTRKNTFDMPFLMSSDEAAKRIDQALQGRPYEFAFPKRLSALLWLGRHLPKWWLGKFAPNKHDNS
ncbi:SDR family NAD(P)-dependent oxidoreductase [Marinomonas posidonica]|uniref:Short-chain dehydrogenase/reductase SDR n=1 Tax=Marinomonas posidonica (strain CECT 7376 / NCIMB 14433 / IVIA-Po-181) TaxID=491952 RepID=F6CSN7_MARPP|nr:SDR family NAD(P)-dependent oxidoreductase [Marinomonas posidonica]AEF56195.1 short-chain dehydrogenase/reductase SDR [Marinomonas posidonica IVIA-Po-181]